MPKSDLICGLDIGSDFIRIVAGSRNPADDTFYIAGVAEHPSEGISKGVISNMEEAASSISAAVEQVEHMLGRPLESVYVSISGTHIITQASKGVIAVSRADGEIREGDVERVIEAAQAVASPPNYEVLHVIPREFTVDNQTKIKDPVGMTGVRLEVEVQIIQGLSSQIKNLIKTVYRTGLDINDVVFNVLATAEATLTKRQKELGVVVVNLGAATTSYAVFEEGDVLTSGVLPVGSDHITSDIAIGLRTSLEVAENVKLEYGQASSEGINKREEINLSDFSTNEEGKVSLKHVIEIIEARLEEIFEMVDKKLKKVERSGLLPAGVVLTGGGAKLPGIVEVAKKSFRLPAAVGLPLDFQSTIEKVNDTTFATAVGLLRWGQAVQGTERKMTVWNFKNLPAIFDSLSIKIKSWWRSLLPSKIEVE